MRNMKTFAAAVALLGASAGIASAADLYTGGSKDGAGTAVNWTGIYAGINGGYFWQDAGISDNGIVGGQVGVNIQRGNIVFGVETDLDAVTTAGDVYIGTVRGRLGVAADHWLFYGTGGYAYAGANCSGCTADGWVAGGGVEYKFDKNWSLKTEYQHVELSTSGGDLPAADAIKFGVNFAVTSFDTPLK
jgi:outer membrane immunogenic protein